MNSSSTQSDDPLTMSRRQAIQRVALMLGVAISPSIVAGVLRAQPVAAGAAAKPAYLTQKQFEIAAAAAERILPRTDTPGATDVGVPAFIDLMVGKFMTAEERAMFTAGLALVEAMSLMTASLRRTEFVSLPAAEQDAILRRIAVDSQAKEKSFFHQLRELTLLGYFTSEPVAKNVLHYDPVPGKFQADVPLAEVGNRAWAR